MVSLQVVEAPRDEPGLPLELERIIFEIVASSCPKFIPVLMLVAARVRNWVEPLLYRVIYCSASAAPPATTKFPKLDSKKLLSIIETKSPKIFHSVRYLFIEDLTEEDANRVIGACSNVYQLFEYYTPSHVDTFAALHHLRRLTIGLRQFLNRWRRRDDWDVAHVFTQLTHIEFMNTDGNGDVLGLCSILPLMSRLTHISLNSFLNHISVDDTMREQKTLLCIIALVPKWAATADTHPLADDDRFVCVQQHGSYRTDWLRGADTGEDYWALADEFIMARRSGRVE
ncbi:hypothetical protein R3P38DRAFT_2625992 [Favolaschia claudopus]|uniref:Uncharacterized protein n=1 Tax=Favolaschia claudopus TaxID=2862362 RepID=A0AAW0BIU3_9AGAR